MLMKSTVAYFGGLTVQSSMSFGCFRQYACLTRSVYELKFVLLKVRQPDRVSVAVHVLGNYGGYGVVRLMQMNDRRRIADAGRAFDLLRTVELPVRDQKFHDSNNVVFSKIRHV